MSESPNVIVRESSVAEDAITAKVSELFDVPFAGTNRVEIRLIEGVPDDWGIGLIVGQSGAGKSTLLREFGMEESVEWDPQRAVASHFADADDATARLSATGLRSIPTWLRPYHVLSTGEKFRADLARRLKDGAVIDEFTSVVDRDVAASASVALSKYVKRRGLRKLVLATCHYDVIEWLAPDWVYDASQEKLLAGRSLQRPPIPLELRPCDRSVWRLFKQHHYLTGEISNAAQCFVAVWRRQSGDVVVGFTCYIHFPHPKVPNAKRLHRLVVLPEYQGLGIGWRIREAVGELLLNEGFRVYTRLGHPVLIAKMKESPRWRLTSDKPSGPTGATTSLVGEMGDGRPTTGFEYIGDKPGERLRYKPPDEHFEERRKNGARVPSDEKRCDWVISGVGRCRAPKTKDEPYCLFHGSRHAEISEKGGEAAKTLWADIQAKAKQLPAKDWPGYKTLVLGLVRDQVVNGAEDVRGLSALLKNLEKGLEQAQGDQVGEYRFGESLKRPDGERPRLEDLPEDVE